MAGNDVSNLTDLRRDAETIFYAGIEVVTGDRSIHRHCRRSGSILSVDDLSFDLNHFKRIYLIGAGKATAAMASAMEQLVGDRLTAGLITVKYGHAAPLYNTRIIEAGHPVPDEKGKNGAESILEIAESAGAEDLVICLLSGGGSALLPLPAPPVSLGEKQETIRLLLSCGASIEEINAVRKHISAIKGGQLARAAFPATMLSLIISDVVGDKLDVIASGPSVADSSRYADCLKIVNAYGLAKRLPESVIFRLEAGAAGKFPETPKPGDPALVKSETRIIAANASCLAAAKTKAESLGYNTMMLSSMIEGDTRGAARLLCAVAKEVGKTGNPLPPPACILSGGETTVNVTGSGLGGRNQEFALVSAFEIAGEGNCVILSGGTDGTDGPTDAAGAVVDSGTIRKARASGLDPDAYLKNNDSYHLFRKTGDLLFTGPTGTNVMDLRIILVG